MQEVSRSLLARQQIALRMMPPPPGPGTVFLQSSHVGRISHSMWMERLVHRAGGTAGDFVKVAIMVVACLFMVIALIPDNTPP